MKLEGIDLFSPELQKDFQYICHPDEIPGDIRVRDWIQFFFAIGATAPEKQSAVMKSPEIEPIADKRFDDLTAIEKQNVTLAIIPLVRRKVVLINDLNLKLPDTRMVKVQDAIDELLKLNTFVLMIASESVLKPDAPEILHDNSDFIYYELWHYREIENRHKLNMDGKYNGPLKPFQDYPFSNGTTEK